MERDPAKYSDKPMENETSVRNYANMEVEEYQQDESGGEGSFSTDTTGNK